MAQFTVTGKVTNKSTGTPLPNLKVIAVDADDPNATPLGSIDTDSNGNYSISFSPSSNEITFFDGILNGDA